MHETVKTIAYYVAGVSEGIAVLLITVGIAGALWINVRKTFFVKPDYHALAESRSHLGHSLSL